MVVVEHQPGALLIGVVEGQRAWTGIGHVRHVDRADAHLVGGDFTGRDGPLVRRAVADPRGERAVEVQRGAVLLEILILNRAHAGAHDGFIHRDEQVPARAGGQQVAEQDTHGFIFSRKDRRPQVVRVVHAEISCGLCRPTRHRVGNWHCARRAWG